MMIKKIIALAAALTIAFTSGMYSEFVKAESELYSYSEITGDKEEILFTFILNEDGTAEITEWVKEDGGNIEIPAVLDDGTVITSIGDYAFADVNCHARVISVPSTVTRIGEGAFLNCEHLDSFVVPDSVEEIGDCALGCMYDEKSETVYLNEDYKIYGYDNTVAKKYAEEYGIKYCDSSELIRYTEINGGMYVDYADHRIHKAVIPETVKGLPVVSLGGFSGCEYLEEITLPDTLTKIQTGALSDTAVSKVVIPENVSEIGANAFRNCIYLGEIRIPDKVKLIEQNTFENCYSLEKIELGDSITRINQYAFADCVSLKSIDLPAGLTTLSDFVFTGTYSLERINVPEECKVFYDDDGILFRENHWQNGTVTKDLIAYPASREGESYTVPSGVQKIGKGAFLGCQNLKSVTISSGTEAIYDQAFSDSESLESVKIPESVWIVEKNFTDCPNLTVYAEGKARGVKSLIDKYGTREFGNYVFTDSSEDKTAGDCNNDGSVNAADVLVMVNYLFGSGKLGSASKSDMNSDGKINIADLCLLKNTLLSS